ncbi:MAG: hypothetical protein Q7U30_13175, partial [Methylicorpusculum sp.]|nr:hypothetical protein [Methylicorpusculum sp.]
EAMCIWDLFGGVNLYQALSLVIFMSHSLDIKAYPDDACRRLTNKFTNLMRLYKKWNKKYFTLVGPTLLVTDNAPIHPGYEFKGNLDRLLRYYLSMPSVLYDYPPL